MSRWRVHRLADPQRRSGGHRETGKADRDDRREERKLAERERWRETAAGILARAREFLSDLHPIRVLGPITKETAFDISTGFRVRWDALREPLASLAVGHPSEDARKLADESIAALHRTLHWVSWMLSDFACDRAFKDPMEEATKEWEGAKEVLDRLREALHESPVSPESAE